MDEKFYKLDKMVMDAFTQRDMLFAQMPHNSETESDIHNNVVAPSTENLFIKKEKEESKEYQFAHIEQLALKTEIDMVKHELRSTNDNYYCTDQELYAVLINSDSEDEVFDGHEEDRDDDEWETIFPPSDNENASDDDCSSDDDAHNVVHTRKKKKPVGIGSDNFKWTETNLNPKLHNFNSANSGCQLNYGKMPSVLDIFESFVTEQFVQQIADQTKLYYDQSVANDPKNATKNYKPPATDDIYVFLAASLLMPLVKKHKIKDYWSKDILIETPIFGQMMSRDRYLSILRSLHFADNASADRNDRLFKIRRVVDYFKTTFKRAFYPFQNVAVNESLVFFKGKRRFGVKFFVLLDCETRYVLDFIIYTGGNSEIQDINVSVGKSGNIVLSLTEPLWGKGHRLFADDSYSRPSLFEFLFHKQVNCCGTVKPSRQYMPKFLKKQAKGALQCFATLRLLALQWSQGSDKRDVYILTSMHNAATQMTITSRNREVEKPVCVIDYNSKMKGIDQDQTNDVLLSSTESARKSIKWYKKVFFHLLDYAVLNAHVVYKMQTGDNIPLLEFQKTLVRSLIEKHKKVEPRSSCCNRPSEGHSPLRLVERHFPSGFPAKRDSKKKLLKQCVVCSKHGRRKATSFTCMQCNVALCVHECFERYHTVVKF